ncbi:MAG: class I SAM-dependent methyltransferase [Candidatus Aminicenantes bacterium]|nr:class I SAM-dependent methyltransferase [Candidatus Aminicenantes bacterium]
MKRNFALVIWIVFFFTLCARPEVSGQGIKETTIRNVTGKTLRYSITPAQSDKKPIKRILKAGEIDRYQEYSNFDVTYKKGKTYKTRRIYRGRPYSFRLDENEELELYDGSHGRSDAPDLAPYVPTPENVVEKMLSMAQIDKDDILYDLGCGDGRIVIAAAIKYGIRGVGVDIDPKRISESNAHALYAGVENIVEFKLQDVFKVDFSEATVIMVYLLPESLRLLRPVFDTLLAPGTIVVSHNYAVPGWEHKEIDYTSLAHDEEIIHTVYVYRK